MFTTDGDILFYNVSVENPFEVFGNLQIRSTSNTNTQESSLTRKLLDTWQITRDLIPDAIEKPVNLRWSERSPRPSTSPIGLVPIQFGAQFQAVGWVNWQFQGFGNLRVDLGVGFEGKLGIGFQRRTQGAFAGEFDRVEVCQELHQTKGHFAGIGIGGSLKLCTSLLLRYRGSVRTADEKDFGYYREVGVTGWRSAVLATSGSIFAQPKVEIIPSLNEAGAAGLNPIPELVGGSWSFNPLIEIYGKTEIDVGGEKGDFRLGVQVFLPFDFAYNSVGCQSPAIWRSVGLRIAVFRSGGPLWMHGWKFLGLQDDQEAIYDKETYVSGCIFGGVKPSESTKGPVVEFGVLVVGSSKPVSFGPSELHGVLRFGDEFTHTIEVGNIYGIFELPDAAPLIEAQQLTDTLWLIPLGQFPKVRGIQIPFRRWSKGKLDNVKIGVAALFQGDKEPFCRALGRTFQVGGLLSPGCIEPLTFGGQIAEEWSILTLPKGGLENVEVTRTTLNGVNVQSFKFKGQVTEAEFARSKYIIGKDVAFIVILSSAVSSFAKRNIPIDVVAVDAVKIGLVSRREVRSWTKPAGSSNVFKFWVPDFLDDKEPAQLWALTGDRNLAFRVFNFEVQQLSLLRFQNPGGLIPVYAKDGQRIESNFRAQIVRPGEQWEVYKTWQGEVPAAIPLPNDAGIYVVCEKFSDKRVLSVRLVTPKGGNISLPWGVRAWVKSPRNFLSKLGVSKSSLRKGYTADGVNFTADGVLEVKNGLFHCKNLNPAKLPALLDLEGLNLKKLGWKIIPERHELTGKAAGEKNQEDVGAGGEGENGLEADEVVMIEVAVGAFVGSLVIGLIGLAVYRRRVRGKEEGESKAPDKPSADEVREEGLTERVE